MSALALLSRKFGSEPTFVSFNTSKVVMLGAVIRCWCHDNQISQKISTMVILYGKCGVS